MRCKQGVWALVVACGLMACTRPVSITGAVEPGQWPDTVAVVGRGEAQGQADVATFRLGVETRAATAAAALQQGNARLVRVRQVLTQAGVLAADVQTERLSVQLERREPRPRPLTAAAAAEGPAPKAPSPPPPTVHVQHTLRVKVRDLSRLGAMLSQAVQAGANQLWGLQLVIDDPTSLRTKARQHALDDASRTAKQLAQHAGARLGRVLSVREGPVLSPGRPLALSRRLEAEAAIAPTPIEGGTLQVSAQVQVLYALER